MTKKTFFEQIHVDQENFVVIAQNNNVSTEFDCSGTQLVGFYCTEEMSALTVTFVVRNRPDSLAASLYNGGGTPVLVNYPLPVIGAGERIYVPVDIPIFAGVRYVSLVTSADVLANTLIELAVRPT